MSRVKGGVISHKHRRNVLEKTKGFRWGRKSKLRAAKDALRHAWEYAYRDRKAKKRLFRQDWQRTISSAAESQNINYSKLINALKRNKVELDRKVLAQLAKEHPEAFQKIVEKVIKEI
ncbi:MAG: 50S ribosomal protein L20 [Patescibacteria group bacterium]